MWLREADAISVFDRFDLTEIRYDAMCGAHVSPRSSPAAVWQICTASSHSSTVTSKETMGSRISSAVGSARICNAREGVSPTPESAGGTVRSPSNRISLTVQTEPQSLQSHLPHRTHRPLDLRIDRSSFDAASKNHIKPALLHHPSLIGPAPLIASATLEAIFWG